jgi:hypothetical protein
MRRVRFQIDEGATTGYRLGGSCPDIVSGAVDAAAYGVLGVFPIVFDERLAVTVFVTRSLETLIESAYKVNTGGAVVALVHRNTLAPRDESHRLLRGQHGVQVGSEEDDVEVVEGQRHWAASGNKIGGEPNIFRDAHNWEAALAELRAEGFVHYLQLDVPAEGEPTLDEEWPFPNGMFHLYLHPARHPTEARWFWEF